MEDKLLRILLVIIGAFVGSILSYFYTRWKFHKELLYKSKIEAYKNLIGLLLKFKSLCNNSNNLNTIITVYQDFITALNNSYLFMPDSVYKFISDKIGNPINEAGERAFQKNRIQHKETPVDFISQLNIDVTNIEIINIFIDAFTPMINNIFLIVKKLKEDIGISKLDSKLSK